MRFISLLILALIAFTNCSHRPAVVDSQNTLFPPGIYKHSVRIQPIGLAEMPFKGVLSLSNEELKLILLGPMDITALKIIENFRNKNVVVDITLQELKKYEPRLSYFYEILRLFILFPKNKTSWGSLKIQNNIYYGPHNLTIEIKKMDHGHPSAFEMKHPQFTVFVEEIL